MIEIEAIQMRKDLKKLKEHGFTASSISKHCGNISDRAIREFANKKRTMLSNENHTNLKNWIEETIKTVDDLTVNPLEEFTDVEIEMFKEWLYTKKLNDILLKLS